MAELKRLISLYNLKNQKYTKSKRNVQIKVQWHNRKKARHDQNATSLQIG